MSLRLGRSLMAQTNLLHFILTILHGFIQFYCLLDFRVYNLLKTSCKTTNNFLEITVDRQKLTILNSVLPNLVPKLCKCQVAYRIIFAFSYCSHALTSFSLLLEHRNISKVTVPRLFFRQTNISCIGFVCFSALSCHCRRD